MSRIKLRIKLISTYASSQVKHRPKSFKNNDNISVLGQTGKVKEIWLMHLVPMVKNFALSDFCSKFISDHVISSRGVINDSAGFAL